MKKNMLFILSLFSLCISLGSCQTPTGSQSDSNSPSNSELESITNSESSFEKESSPSGESTPSDSSSPSEESESPSPEPVCEHPLMEETYVAPTKLSQGHTLHSCTTCEYSYKTDFTGALNREVSVDDAELKVLFIGNSYTMYNTSWNIFNNICWSEGNKVAVDNVTCGGYTLEQMNDPLNEYGAKVAEKLKNNKYDVVFLQEQSLRPAIGDEDLFYDAVRGLTQKIRDNGAIPVLYETWGRKEGASELTNHKLTNESMTQKLIASYGAIANELSIDVSHVGTAFYDLYTNNPLLELYNADLSHPSEFGSYVVALTHYTTIFGKSPIRVEYKYFKTDLESQTITEQAVYDAVFGDSILKEEYKTSSEGVTATISEELKTIDPASLIPTEWVDVNHKINLGMWDVSEDENGIATFKNTSNKSMLMFEEELFKNGGRISFDMKSDNLFTGASAQGLVFAANSSDIEWVKSTDYYYVIGRTKDGRPYATGIAGGKIDNLALSLGFNSELLTDTNKTYRFDLVVDYTTDKTLVYVDGTLAGVARFKNDLSGSYIGLSSGINGKVEISNIQINGKGLNIYIPEITSGTTSYKINSGAASIVDKDGVQTIVTSANKTTIMLSDVKVGDGSVIEFDLKSSTSYAATYPQSLIVGAANDDIVYTTKSDNYYGIGRLKNGKVGGYYVSAGSYNFAPSATDGEAVQVMQDVTKTYRIKVVIDYSVESKESYITYVDGVFARTLNFTHGFRGEYIGFTSAASGVLEISNIVVDNVAYTLSNE